MQWRSLGGPRERRALSTSSLQTERLTVVCADWMRAEAKRKALGTLAGIYTGTEKAKKAMDAKGHVDM